MASVLSPELSDLTFREEQERIHQPLELYYTFNSEADRNKAKKLIEDSKQYDELFLRLTTLQNDPSPERSGDGLALRFDRYDEGLLKRVKEYFEHNGIGVPASNEFVVPPDVEQRRAEELMEHRRAFDVAHETPAQPTRKGNVVVMKKPPEPTEAEEMTAAA